MEEAACAVGEECGNPHNLLWDVRRSIRYHNHRRRFFDTWSKLSAALKVITSSATITAALAKFGQAAVTGWAAGVAVLSGLDLIFQPSTVARLHSDLAKRFIALEGEITIAESGVISKRALAELCAKRLVIEADEPPIRRNLDSICHNELCKATDQSAHRVKLTVFQVLTANLFDWRPDSVVRVEPANEGQGFAAR